MTGAVGETIPAVKSPARIGVGNGSLKDCSSLTAAPIHPLVGRPRLIDRLLHSAPAKLVLLLAPAGYSKTTCLRAWSAADPRPFATLSCESWHDDPAALIASIATALDEIGVEADVLQGLSGLNPEMKRVVSQLQGSMLAASEPFVLALDDVHLISAADSLEVIGALLNAFPAGSQLALATRSQPPFSIARMRANRELVELGARDLALRPEESTALLASLGLELTLRQHELLYERTEGWPAAVYLAGVTLVAEPDQKAAVTSFAGDDRLIAEYLRDEVLARFSEEKLAFLIRTSLLDELSGDVCDAALDRSGSARVLQELARENALVRTLDRNDERYRYHHMLLAMLRSEMHRREPEAEPAINARASRWYAEHGHLDRAIDHAVGAGEIGRAGELIWKALPELNGSGRMATLDRWLGAIGERGVAGSVPLALTAAHRDLTLGNGAGGAHWGRVALAASDSLPNDDPLHADLHMIEATLASGGIQRMGEQAELAAELFPGESFWQAPCNLYRGISLHLSGAPDRATPVLREAVRRGAVGAQTIEALALAQLCAIAADDGDWATASRLAAQAREQVTRCNLAEYPVMAPVFSASALVRSQLGKIGDAHADQRRAMTLLAACRDYPIWFEATTRIQLGRASARIDDLEGARQMLEDAEPLVEQATDAPVLAHWLAAATSAIDTVAERRSHSLSRAEMRTLQYLPSQLSIREIGERLFLSTNTIKTQASAVYRKLDASSRTEAVDRARELGLLGHANGPR